MAKSQYNIFTCTAIYFILIASLSFLPVSSQVYGQTTNSSSSNITSSDNIQSSNGTLSLSNSTIPLQREDVVYFNNVSGYLVYPENISNGKNITITKLPAVVMIHEWWGLNEHIKNMADELAKEGYVVLAVDLYNGRAASSPDQAMSLLNTARENQNESISNLQSAVKYLNSLDNVDASKIISFGWCFGGGLSLQLALNIDPSNPLAATILYYGNLVTDQQQLSKINWPVLGIFGSKDQSIPVSEVKKFEESLNANNITNEIYIYEGVGHAFANPTGEGFAPNELQDAWQKTLEFLDTNLK